MERALVDARFHPTVKSKPVKYTRERGESSNQRQVYVAFKPVEVQRDLVG